MGTSDDIVFNSGGQEEFRQMLYDKIYSKHGVSREALNACDIPYLMHSLLGQSGFIRLDPVNYTTTSVALYGAQAASVGYKYEKPRITQMPEGFKDQGWTWLIDALVNGRFNTGQSLHQGNYGDRRYGFADILTVKRVHLEKLLDAIVERLPAQLQDKKLSLPRPHIDVRAEEERSRRMREAKPEEIYDDKDGSLKRAFCEGMGEDPAVYTQPFLRMFRAALEESKVTINTEPKALCAFTHLTGKGGSGPGADCKVLGGTPKNAMTLGRLVLERQALADESSDYFSISSQMRGRQALYLNHAVNGAFIATDREYTEKNKLKESVMPLSAEQVREIGAVLREYGVSIYLKHGVLRVKVDHEKAQKAQRHHAERMVPYTGKQPKPSAASGEKLPATADVDVSEVVENAMGTRSIFIALHRGAPNAEAATQKTAAFMDYAARHGWSHMEEQRATPVTYGFVEEHAGKAGLFAVVTSKDASQAQAVRGALAGEYPALVGALSAQVS